jgi:hypothetical protein
VERLLEVGQPCVRPAEDGHLVVRHAGGVQRAHLLDDVRLLELPPRTSAARLGPARRERAQHLLRAAERRDDPVRQREHFGRRAVVRLEAHDGRVREALRQAEQVLRRRAGERVDRLVVVADRAELVARAEPAVEQRLLQRLTSWYSSTVKAR